MKGYTLIEILIVMFIISIVTSVALLSIGHNENKKLERFTNELIESITLAEEQAMLQPAVLGLMQSEHAFQFASYQPSRDARANPWQPLQDNVLRKHHIPDSIAVNIEVNGAAKDRPPIIISANGEITPFKIYIGKEGQKPLYVIMGEADGAVTSQLLS